MKMKNYELFLEALYTMPSSTSTSKELKIDLKYAENHHQGIEFNKLKEAS